MATHTFYIYDASVLPYDSGSGTFTFAADYDFTQDRVELTITDDDAFLDGDEHNDEVGEDSNQTGVAREPDGTLIRSGNIYGEQYAIIQAPDGTQITIDRIEIDGQLIGYSPSQPLEPGVTYTYIGGDDIDNSLASQNGADTRLTYSEYQAQSVPCFVSGTMLDTAEGPMPVDWIGVGDRVRTLDRGWQVVRWRGDRAFRAAPDMPAPIEIAPGALGPGAPREVLRLSPQHRIMVSGPICELYFGTPEVFVAARHLLHWPGIRQVQPDPDHAYYHLLLDHHEVLFSDGITLESLFLGAEVEALCPAPPAVLQIACRHGHTETARLSLTAHQARVLLPGSVNATFELTDNSGPEVMAQVA